MPAPLYFIRHGQTNWNAEARLQGQTDVPLNERGRGQARRNGLVLKDLIDPAAFHFVASPLMRTRETMEIMRTEMGIEADAYTLDDRLLELSFGDWEGYTADELSQKEKASWDAREADKWRYVPPGGESYAMLVERLRDWFHTLDRPSVVVSHGGVNRALRAIVEDRMNAESARLSVPQDKIMILRDGQIEWV